MILSVSAQFFAFKLNQNSNTKHCAQKYHGIKWRIYSKIWNVQSFSAVYLFIFYLLSFLSAVYFTSWSVSHFVLEIMDLEPSVYFYWCQIVSSLVELKSQGSFLG